MKPIIGITLDLQPGGGYSDYEWYSLRTHYTNAIFELGGTAILLPYNIANDDNIFKLLDGMIVPGGDWDIDPELYGEKPRSKTLRLNSKRFENELKIMEKILSHKIPLLAICAGHQSLNVMMGGSLYQDIDEEVENHVNHYKNGSELAHDINITPGSLLHKIMATTTIGVNSHHHQAVKRLGKGLIASSVAPDGIVESIEHPDYKFCMGVEWHPEFLLTDYDRKLISTFVDAAANYAREK